MEYLVARGKPRLSVREWLERVRDRTESVEAIRDRKEQRGIGGAVTILL
jgi:hypothetical protein